MTADLEPNTAQRKPRFIWKGVLFDALLLWIGATNLGPALGLYDKHRGTPGGLLLLVCECALLVGSGGAIALGAGPLLIRETAVPAEHREDWGGINAKRLRRLAIVSFVGLAWCLGTLR
jgi:hypothetical protein